MSNKQVNFRCPEDLLAAIEQFALAQYPKTKSNKSAYGDQSKAIIHLLKLALEAHAQPTVLLMSNTDVRQGENLEIKTLLSSIRSELQSLRNTVGELSSSIESTQASLSSLQDNLLRVEKSVDLRIEKLEQPLNDSQSPQSLNTEATETDSEETSTLVGNTESESSSATPSVLLDNSEAGEISSVESEVPQQHSKPSSKTEINLVRSQILKRLKMGSQSPRYKAVAKALNNFIDELNGEDPNKADLIQIRSKALQSIKSGKSAKLSASDVAAIGKALDDLMTAIA